MASQAEVDLVISTADALPELERDLSAIIRTAENGAPTLDVDAALAVAESLTGIAEQIEGIIQQAEAGASDIDLEAALDVNRSISHINGQIESLVQRAAQGDEIELQAELDMIGSLQDVQSQLRTLVAEAEATAPEIEIEAEIDRDGTAAASVGRLGKVFRGLAGPLAKVSGGILGAGVAAASAAPLLAGVATAVEAIAPAAAVAVPAMAAVALVGGTVKLAMIGVGDAVKTAFDPEAKPEDLAEAMEKLAPNARAFVTELQGMRKGLGEIQQQVQQNFFAGFDGALRNLSTTVLPVTASALRVTSQTLNQMALGAADAAVQLAQDGTLGRALGSANNGLANLSKEPGRVVTALGQLAAAAGPSFERITAAVAKTGASVSEKLTGAFEDGRLEAAIEGAIDVIAQLGRVAGNVFGGLGNIIGAVSEQGGGLFATLEKVTQAFEDVTASQGFQQALKALLSVGGTLVDTVLPLIGQALAVLGPVFQALQAPVEILVRALGEGLSQVLAALGPVLVSAAQAFGQLVLLATPFIKLAATLIAAILPVLTPLFDALGQAMNQMLPFVEQLVTNVASQLVPIFTKLATEVLPQLLPPLLELSSKIFPVLTEILVALAPSLAKLGETFGELLVALTPLLVELANLTIALVDELLPVIQPVLDAILKLVEFGLKVFSAQIRGLVIPIIEILVNLLKGDFSAAWEGAKNLVQNVANKIAEITGRMRDAVVEKLKELTREAVKEFQAWVDRSVERARELPGKVKDALGNLGTLLLSAGADIVRGLINGLQSKLGDLRDAASKIADTVSGSVKGLLGISSPSKVMMEVGNDTMDGFLLGIAERIPDLRKELQGVAALAPSFALPGGQSFQLPQLGQTTPTVQVFIGNEQLTSHFDTRIAQNNQARDRLAITGVRR